MKILVILFFALNGLFTSPIDFKEGTPMQDVLTTCPDYHFMFYKKTREGFQTEMTFGMLGYWNQSERKGYVLQFTGDKLVGRYDFDKFKEYSKFITNPEENENITIRNLKAQR